MNFCNDTCTSAQSTIRHDLGTFEGFNFRSQSAISQNLTAEEVVGWDHDRQGEAEFWPAGDRPEVGIVFHGRSSVTAGELLALDRLLDELGGDSVENFLRVHYAVNTCGADLATLTRREVEDNSLDIFLGSNFTDLRREAAYQLFELFYPDEYRAWEKTTCDGLIFDTDRFLDSPAFCAEEIDLGDQVALLVASQ
jgi:hypothetical protein